MVTILVNGKRDRAALKDWVLGFRIRRSWESIVDEGRKYNLSKEQIQDFTLSGGLNPSVSVEDKKKIAKELGFDWEAAAEFFVKIAPVIIEMMAACGL